MRGARVAAVFSLISLILGGASLLVFVCVHYANWWSLFILLPCILAFISPAICFGYETADFAMLDVEMNKETFSSCRELGWSLGILLWAFAFVVPILAWYNSGLHWIAVLLVDVSVTCLLWSYVLWLRVFVYQ